jgi:dihydroorotate dehydrogenase (fumarate)/dihydroorotate dehydrogenase
MNPYRALLRPLLFRADAEAVHRLAIGAAEWAGKSAKLCAAIERRLGPHDARLAIEVAGLRMRSPIGLAAGFDKSARAVHLLAALGFGHVEVGSISADASAGNPRPRLFRIPRDRGIVVHYGLPNDGADRIARRLAARRRPGACLGINIVSTNRGPDAPPASDDDVIGDYLGSASRLAHVADYLSLNLSCPNTRDGQQFFHGPRRLRRLLDGMDALNVGKPVFLKVAPFADEAELERFLENVAPARCVSGFSVNLPPGKPVGLSTPADALARMPGAVSGAPAAARADATIRDLYRRMDRARYRIIGSGGVFDADDAYRKIRLGASLVQLMTALVYEGPGVVAAIHAGLARRLEADGFAHAVDAVGVDAMA